jgi:hypothetical protein
MNYFNYFTEVEEEFVRRRGKSLLVSPMDWALIESWKNAGIPLHIVLRAINQAFDAYDARPRRYRRVNSVFYCQQEVESTYAEYRLAQVGGKKEEPVSPSVRDQTQKPAAQQTAPAFPKEVLTDFLSRSDQELAGAESAAHRENRSQAAEVLSRARERIKEIAADIQRATTTNAEALEHDLDSIDRMMLDALRREAGEVRIAALRQEAAALLKSYQKKMDRAVYEQTINNFVARRLREINGVPRLSLFYL